jgi:hypothetical protein
MSRATFVAAIFIVFGHTAAQSQIRTHCVGDILKIFAEPPFEIAVNSRVEQGPDFKLAVTCVENRRPVRTQVHWTVPGHHPSFAGLGISESPRAFSIDTNLAITPGCLYYGQSRLNTYADVGYFYGDGRESTISNLGGRTFVDAKQECVKRMGQNETGKIQLAATRDDDLPFISTKNKIPEKVKYHLYSDFFLDSIESDERIIHILFEVSFINKGNRAVLDLKYDCLVKPGNPDSYAKLSLRPIINDTKKPLDDLLASGLKEDRFKKTDNFIIEFPLTSNSKFGSAQIGIYSKDDQLLSSLWIPVVF